MAETVQPILCRACNIATEAIVDPDGQNETMVVCPKCGLKDSLDNAMREVSEYLVRQTLNRAFSGISSPNMTVKSTPEPHYRFIPG